jgi:hypothetical protein
MMHAYAYAMQMQCNYGAKHLRCYTALVIEREEIEHPHKI